VDRRQPSDLDDILLVRTGGHFAGGTSCTGVRRARRGALLTGDVAMVAMDRRSLSFMYSFPNYIPLNAAAVRRIWAAVEPLAFDRIYGAWWGRNIATTQRLRSRCPSGGYRGDLRLKQPLAGCRRPTADYAAMHSALPFAPGPAVARWAAFWAR
jgi:hypothetical protein